MLEINNWFKFGVKPVGTDNFYFKLKQDNGLNLNYLPINENKYLPIDFGKWLKEFFRLNYYIFELFKKRSINN